ncbi:HAL/PAL/TAL family ammonia-lyase [Actinoallomurus soli]|uniref:HAL/PAL/TAL family ammonia-lyase n=1 Tax=Actinoallomurus soli TaxID=2952535 RepID=UPI002093F283|nr:aromatic amino acid ammonia-lyase [Actinoallomurus soli]MCO5968346.1 aromatic amino acid ammonia-lyase [Actinoallomurus soli]
MTSLLIDGHSLTLADIVAVARHPGTVHLELADEAARRMQLSDELKTKLIETDIPIYGVTSGFGDSNTRQIGTAKVEELQRNLIRFLGCGVGTYAAPDVARATMLVRANCLARGHSGVRPQCAANLLECLNHDILPLIPEQGSVGASGDLVPLSYIAALLTGEGTVLHHGVERPAAEALAEVGIEALTLGAKEGLGLVNGTSFMSGFAALALHGAAELAYAADLCTAMASSVLRGNPGHFAAFLFEQKPHDGVIASARTIRRLLGGANAQGPEAAHMSEDGFRELDDPIQDRYSIRCAPHVIGVLRDTVEWAARWVTVEVNSSNDNPLFDVAEGAVRNGGNFYGGHVGQAMDALKTAVASVADLLDRQLELVVDEKFNNGLTPNLIPAVAPDSHEAGLHHGFKGMQIAASSLAAEALKNTMPATSFSRSTEAHNQDKVSMGTIAARDARTVLALAQQVAAIHLLALSQAADLRGDEIVNPAVHAARGLVREVSPHIDGDRPLRGDVARVAELVTSGTLRQVLAEPAPFAEALSGR